MFKSKLFKSRKRKFVLLAVVAVVTGFTAFGAYAYWTSTGAGDGTASTGTTTTVTVNQLSTVSGLYPGGPAVALSGNFDNPNSGKVYIGSVTASVTDTSAGTDCAAGNFQIGGTSNTPGEIVAGNGVGSWSGLTIKMLDPNSNQDLCKNVTVNIHYVANAS